MKVIVIANPKDIRNEAAIVNSLFKAGLQRFHLRKPDYGTKEMRSYLENIEAVYHNRIIIHSHHFLMLEYNLAGIHLSEKNRVNNRVKTILMTRYLKMRLPNLSITTGYHTISALKADNYLYEYVFLSPVFDSISKIGYRATFNEDSLQKVVHASSVKVIALGGVDEDKIEKAYQLGFSGVALLGSIWNAADPVNKFQHIQHLCSVSDHL